MCLYPRLIQNRKYIPNKKNKGRPPPVQDVRTKAVPIGCGKCMECMKQKSREWNVRLQEEIRTNTNGKFVTLTFSDKALEKIRKKHKELHELDGYKLENQTAKIAVRKFLERWRAKHKKSVKHWLITELGHNGTERIHLHGILWTDTPKDIEPLWKYGYVWIGQYVNESTITYISKYVTKTDQLHKEYKPKIMTSPGIGSNYINRPDSKRNQYNEKGETIETYKNRSGRNMALPIYYRNKIYTEEEKEKLWIQKLDKEERWINGERVDISTEAGKQEYFKLLEFHRAKNASLGYGTSKKDWEQQEYEEERRKLLKERRR